MQLAEGQFCRRPPKSRYWGANAGTLFSRELKSVDLLTPIFLVYDNLN